MKDAALAFAKHITVTTYDDITKEALESTKKSILDTLGVIVAASGVGPECRKVVDLVKEVGGREESSILAFGGKVPAMMAAFANGAMSKALNYDDVVGEAFVHPTANTLPAALAVSERVGKVSGKELITAVTLGIDLVIRMGLASTQTGGGFKYGWHPMMLGVFSAAAVAGKLLQLSEDKMADTLGIAFLQASGSLQMAYSEGATVSLLAYGFPGKAGVLSALMAERGITGIKDCLESKAGLFNLYFRGNYDSAYLTDNLGRRFEGINIGFKPWPTCRRTHTYIPAALDIVHEYNIRPEDVAEIKVFIGDEFSRSLCEPLEARRRPQTRFFANTNIPFVVASAVAKRKVVIGSFSQESLKDPITLEVAQKVTPRFDPQLDVPLRYGIPPGIVEIKTSTGGIYSKKVEVPYGHPKNPITMDDLLNKFKDCCSCSVNPIPQGNVKKAIELILNLEEVDNVSEVIELFT